MLMSVAFVFCVHPVKALTQGHGSWVGARLPLSYATSQRPSLFLTTSFSINTHPTAVHGPCSSASRD